MATAASLWIILSHFVDLFVIGETRGFSDGDAPGVAANGPSVARLWVRRKLGNWPHNL